LKINEAALGPDDAAVGLNLTNLAAMYDALGQYAKAEKYYLRTLKINEAVYGADHINVALTLNNLAALCTRLAVNTRRLSRSICAA